MPPMIRCAACHMQLALDALECPSCGIPVGVEATTVRPAVELIDGKWHMGRELGRGGMGTVYLATDVTLDRPVAIKMLVGQLAADEEVVARFDREARMMARLEHPNLVPIYAVGQRNGIPFLVMKYLDGHTLSEHIAAQGRLTLEDTLAIMRQICSGLGFIHTRGVVHRDVKPANIFVGPEGHVTVLDLGVAHDSRSNLTRSGMLIGTPQYMSPEQILGKKVDHRSDLYSLGALLFEMLTGARAFDAPSEFSVMKAHTDLPPPDPAQHLDLPRALSDVVLKSLAKAPEDRFQDAEAMFKALERATRSSAHQVPTVRDQSPGAPPSTGSARPLEPSVAATTASPGRGRTPSPARPPDGADTAAMIDASGRQMPRADTAMELAALRRSGRRRGVVAGAALLGIAGIATAGWLALGAGGPGPSPLPVAVVPPPIAPPPIAPPPVAPPPIAPPPIAVADPPETPAPAVPSEPPQPTQAAPPPSGAATTAKVAKGAHRQPQEQPAAGSAARRRPAELRVGTTEKGELSWAWVDLNGVRKGSSPWSDKLEPGSYTLKVERPGYRTVTQQVTLKPGETRRIVVELIR